MRVLLVENDKMIIKIIANCLLSRDCAVVSIQNGYDALKVASEEHFDAIISNVFLTQLSGLEFIGKLSTSNSLRPPVYVISKTPNEDLEFEAYQLGAIDFITIPFDPVLLIEKMISDQENRLQKNAPHINQK
ncbi:response regulator [Pedobacter punctiformis]|uniref:Response regulator n=1 Tax=Pedobacter punctiformis TaxID=3004097 RepID=A0ABT4L3B7_9SPHI|nr:response regulator [Pedobacter sp. HCMS5-2]MCZ4242412.1 response regulator [Pedobacter sp. HCMS5-2]